MPAPTASPRIRKNLCTDAVLRSVKAEFEGVPDWPTGDIDISMADALMSGFAMFSF